MTGFERFGKYGYVSQSKVTPIVTHLEKGELVGTKCNNCGKLYFPPRMDCPNCMNSNLEWTRLDPDCKLVSYTEVHFAPPQFQKETPYLVGVADLRDGPRVFAPIASGLERGKLRPGLGLVLRIVKSDNGVFYELDQKSDR